MMFQRLFCFLVVVLILSMAGNVSADLMAYWRFNEASGDTVEDSSGNGNQGTIENALWVGGKDGAALEFDGVSARVVVPDSPSLHSETGDISIAAWIKVASDPKTWSNAGPMVFKQDAYQWNVNSNGALWFGIWGARLESIGSYDFSNHVDEWHHATLTFEGANQNTKIYVDGELNIEGTVSEAVDPTPNELYIGYKGDGGTYFDGIIDEVRIDDNVLTEAEILSAMQVSEGYPFAYGPEPADGAVHADTWVNLSWKPGDFATSHDLYLGENFNDVNEASQDSELFRGNQTNTFLVVGFPGFPYPEGLVPGTTYYWRVDEVNETDPNSPWKGPVWSFSIPPKTAYNPNPADGAEFVDPNNTKLSWTPGFGAILHTVYFGEDFDEVGNATVGIPAATPSYSPGPLEREKIYYWRVDEFDGAATYKGDVWSFTTPGAVGNPKPSYGANDVSINAILSWTPADSAASHELYFGTDKETVRNAAAGLAEHKGSIALGAESYDPGLLEADTTYYWRVDEVDGQGNSAKGPLWVFTTGNYLLIDDFEGYTDDDPNNEAIWQHWIDGFGVADNGSQVGNLVPPYAEQTVVHDGAQSMPLFYTNEGGVTNSEATLTLTSPRDWTLAGVSEFSVWFRGASGNAADPLYMAVSNSTDAPAIVTQDDPQAATVRTWMQWRIPLQGFADQGINLSNVDKITVGVGSKGGVAVGGSGTLYVDDIRLY